MRRLPSAGTAATFSSCRYLFYELGMALSILIMVSLLLYLRCAARKLTAPRLWIGILNLCSSFFKYLPALLELGQRVKRQYDLKARSSCR